MTQIATCPICSNQAHYAFSGRDLMFDLRERYDYFECKTCRLVFQHPMPSMEKIASFYPEDYCVFSEEKRIRRIRPFRKALLAVHKGYRHLSSSIALQALARITGPGSIDNTPAFAGGGKMLDVGCGNGRYLLTMRNLGWDVQGVEFSESGVRVCQMENLLVHHGDLASARFPDASFDLITVRHVIEHVPDPRGLMTELARVLKTGGRLVIETPNSMALGRSWFATNWYANDVPRHLVLFSPENLAQLGVSHGLMVLETKLDTSPKIILNSLDYALGSSSVARKRKAVPRFLARIYVRRARKSGKGDTLQVTFKKPESCQQ